MTDAVAKFDFMIEEVRKRNILTIGFGDGGNEIGMGNILARIEEFVPSGKLVGAVAQTDILVVASSAGWSAYGVEACIAALSGKPHALHDEGAERRVLDASVNGGIVDPLTGTTEGYLDGVPAPAWRLIWRGEVCRHLRHDRSRSEGGAVHGHLRILPTPQSVAPLCLGLEDASLITSDVVAATQIEAYRKIENGHRARSLIKPPSRSEP